MASAPVAAALLCALFSLFWAACARAQSSEPVALEWNAPPDCPRGEDVRALVRKLAGPLKTAGSDLRAEATVTRADGGTLHMHLVVRSGKLVGERDIEGKSCKGLVGATAVTLVLLLNATGPLSQEDLLGRAASEPESNDEVTTDSSSNQAAGRDTRAASPPPSPEAAPARLETDRPPAVSTVAVPKSERPWRVLLQAPQLELGLGPLSKPDFGIALAAGAAFARWRLLAQASDWFPQHASISNDGQPYGSDIHRLTATLLACRALVSPRFELAPCVSFSVEHIAARGTGAHIAAHTADVSWVAAGVGAQARWHVLPRMSLVSGIQGQVETSRPQLSLDGVAPVERLLPAGATVSGGFEWIF